MVGLLITLIYINLYIKELQFGFIKAAFGIYLGWICIATIANVTALLVNTGWNGFGISQEVWTIVMISVGTLLATLTLYRLGNPFLGLAVIWAFTGIIIKRHDDFRSIVITAVVGITIVTIVTIYEFFRKSVA